jgi:hypothetical protein
MIQRPTITNISPLTGVRGVRNDAIPRQPDLFGTLLTITGTHFFGVCGVMFYCDTPTGPQLGPFGALPRDENLYRNSGPHWGLLTIVDDNTLTVTIPAETISGQILLISAGGTSVLSAQAVTVTGDAT